MFFHKEGKVIIRNTLLIIVALIGLSYGFVPAALPYVLVVCVVMLVLVLQFFRNPTRQIAVPDDKLIYAPADGKVVVIEPTEESEYFKDRRLQVSIFMSPINVHVNRVPVSGIVNYYRYHAGKYLVAWHPKASTENERTTTVIQSGNTEILLRQIAGALAKRIVNYVKEGQRVEQGADMGFIKFGSRVDIFLPLDAEVKVALDQKVSGNITVIARLA